MQPSAQQTRQPAKAPPKKVAPKKKAKPRTAVAVYDPSKQPAPRSMIEVIAQAARDPSVDVKKMQELLTMQRQIEQHEAERLFNEAMKTAQEQMPKVLKDAKTDKAKYATLERVNNIVLPVAQRLGFALSFGTEESHLAGHYRVTCVVSHIAGYSRSYRADVPADNVGQKGELNKTPTHAFGSAMSYARRYLTLLIFNVVPTEKDDDGNAAGGNAPISKDQFERLEAILDEVGMTKEKFCEWAKIDGLAQLTASRYPKAVNLLEQRRAAQPRGPA